MTHLHEIEAKDNEQEIKQFTQEFVELWLEKHRGLERFDLLQVLVELILNPNAQYYQMNDKERDTWLLCAIVYLASEMKENLKVFIPPSAQMEAVCRFVVGFDDSDLCDDCKKELRKTIETDIAIRFVSDSVKAEHKAQRRRRRQRKKNKESHDDKMTPLECAERNGDL